MKTKLNYQSLVVLLLFILLLLNVLSVMNKTVTYDEGMHFKYGVRITQLNSNRFDDSKMPFSVLNAVPNSIGRLLKPLLGSGKSVDFLLDLKTGRFFTTLFSLIVALYVFRWSSDLFGTAGGIFSLFLYTFSPNIIAHSRLVTTDIYAAGMVLISSYHFWRFIKLGGRQRGFISAATLGLSQLAKYTCVFLYPLYLLIIIIKFTPKLIELNSEKKYQEIKSSFISLSKYLLFFMLISLIIINIGFLFNKTFTPLKNYQFKSDLFLHLQSNSLLGNLPAPLPYPYLEGLDLVKYNETTGATFGKVYLFGKLQEKGKGFPGYYFYAFLYKVPIAIQIFFTLALIIYFKDRANFKQKQGMARGLFLEKTPPPITPAYLSCELLSAKTLVGPSGHKSTSQKYDFYGDEIFLFLPFLFFTIYFNFLFEAQIGIRFFLVVFPLIHVFCGILCKNWENFNIRKKSVLVSLGMYLIISVLSYFPHYISYFNEFVWDRKMAYKILANSDLDWGQNDRYLEIYLEKNSQTLIWTWPSFPVNGKVIVNINDLLGISTLENRFKWLRENFEPVDHIGYSYLVYDISPELFREKIKLNPKDDYSNPAYYQ